MTTIQFNKDHKCYELNDNGQITSLTKTINSHGQTYYVLPKNSSNREYIAISKLSETETVDLEQKTTVKSSNGTTKKSLKDYGKVLNENDQKTWNELCDKIEKLSELDRLLKLQEQLMNQINELKGKSE